VIKYLSVQGRLDPRGELYCFWCPNKTSISPIGSFGALKIIKNEIKLQKLWPSKVKGVKD
jgi:hypothetical protein